MNIDWAAFAVVVAVTLVSACGIVTLYSLALRLQDGTARWRRPVATALIVLCLLAVLFGIYLIAFAR